MPDLVLRCQNVKKVFQQGKQKLTVLDGVNLSINKGESIAIMGTSGSGKSTLLNLLGGLDSCTEGDVELLGNRYTEMKEKDLASLRNRELGFVYQFHHLLAEFDALENVSMPLLIRGMSQQQSREKAALMLEKVGLTGRLSHRPSQLSGGERQRVAIARALVAEPACVLMDEPTGNLDEQTAQHILALIKSLNRELSTSFILVTHDRLIAKDQQRVFLLNQGHLSELDKNELV